MFVLLSRIAHRTQHSHWNPQPNSFRKVFVTPQSHKLTACGDTEYLCDFCLCTVRSYKLLALARSCTQGLLDKSIPQEGEPPLPKKCTFVYRLTRHHPLPNTVRQLFAPDVYKQRLQANTKSFTNGCNSGQSLRLLIEPKGGCVEAHKERRILFCPFIDRPFPTLLTKNVKQKFTLVR